MQETFRKLGSFLLDIIQTVVLALSIFVISYLFLVQPHQVRGNSMYPNFENNDFLLTDKISYRFQQPHRGDIVIFKAPSSEPCIEEECEYIKRLIGLPGETISIKDGSYLINNEKLDELYLPQDLKTGPALFLPAGKTITMGTDEYFFSGDNRPYSRDSRAFGSIKKDAIVGKAWLMYWPPRKIGFIPYPHYNF
ncbi:MAG: signal peptidase I [bacterium]|nr:signal peptidase I [bacterium]